MSVKITYFVHGTTTDNLEHKATGWNHGELSQKGKSQAEALRENVKMDEIDFVICSDLQRAIDSANIVFGKDKRIITDSRIRECNYGDLNGEDNSLVKYEEHINDAFPNGESMKDIENRLRDFCNCLVREYDGKHIALMAHKAPQLALEVITKGKTWKEAIETDWRKTKAWQPGWNYTIEGEV